MSTMTPGRAVNASGLSVVLVDDVGPEGLASCMGEEELCACLGEWEGLSSRGDSVDRRPLSASESRESEC